MQPFRAHPIQSLVGYWEDTLGGMGRWIDDRIAGVRSGAGYSAGERVRAVRESVAEGVRSAKAGAAETLDRVKASQPDRDDPRFQRRLLVIGLVLMLAAGIGLGVWLGPRFLGISGAGLSKEDVAALQKLQQRSSGTEVFVTAPPPSAGTQPPATPTTPAASPPAGGGSLFPTQQRPPR
jgi:hypothetical protein